MCNKCKTSSQIIVKINPIEVKFSLSLLKSGTLRRSSDFEASQLFDLDDYKSHEATYICSNCGSEVDLNSLEILKSCQICSNTDQLYCKYNSMNFCIGCAKRYLNYCKTCPYISSCELGSHNVNS